MVSTRSASKTVTPSENGTTAITPKTPSRALAKSSSTSGWSHIPTPATIFWLAVSIPLVAWDTGYVLLRPLTMPGGRFHWPLYVPYKLYGQVDYIYGWKAFNSNNGFTSAQAFLNVIESVMYLAYLWLYFAHGQTIEGSATGTRKSVGGRVGALAILLGFSAAVMTLSKTLLYWMNEFYSGFDNIGHNPTGDLILLWIIPNGAWLVGSAYMIFSMGGEIIDGLSSASKSTKRA